MSRWRTFRRHSGRLLWDSLGQIWQADDLNRTARDPSIPSLPLETAAAVARNWLAPDARKVLALGAVFIAPNLAILVAPADTTVLRAPTVQQQKTVRPVSVVQPPNLLTSTLAAAAVAPPVVVVPAAGVQRTRWQGADTSAGMAQVLRAVVVAEPPVVVTPHITPIKSKWLPGDTSRGIPKPLTQDAQLPFFITQHSAPDRLRPVVDTSQKQPITLQVIVPPAPIANVPFTQPYRGQWSINDTSAGSPATLQIVVGAQPQVTNTLEFAAQFKGGRWSAQPLDTSSGTPVIIAFPPAISPTVTHSGVGFSGVSLPKRDSVHKIEQESVSYKETI